MGCIVTPVIVGRARNLHLGIEIWGSEDFSHCVSILISGVGLEEVGEGLEKSIFGAEGTANRYMLVESVGTMGVEVRLTVSRYGLAVIVLLGVTLTGSGVVELLYLGSSQGRT